MTLLSRKKTKMSIIQSEIHSSSQDLVTEVLITYLHIQFLSLKSSLSKLTVQQLESQAKILMFE